MNIEVKSFFDAATNTISHVVWSSTSIECAIIDPVLDYDPASGATATSSAEKILAFIDGKGLSVRYICETHVHADHLTAAQFLRERTGAPILIGSGVTEVVSLFASTFNDPLDPNALCPDYFDRLLDDNETLPLGDTVLQCLFTPGHTPACVTYVVGDTAFVGDTLFMPDFGTSRTDFPGGNAETLFRSISRILALPPETRLFLCHDYKAPGRDEYAWETTVEAQRRENKHVKDGTSMQDFVKFRTTRDAELKVPALLLPSVQVNLRGGSFPPAESNGVSYLKIPLDFF